MQCHLIGAASTYSRLQTNQERISPGRDNPLVRRGTMKYLLLNMLEQRVHRTRMRVRHSKRLETARSKLYFRGRLAVVKNN